MLDGERLKELRGRVRDEVRGEVSVEVVELSRGERASGKGGRRWR